MNTQKSQEFIVVEITENALVPKPDNWASMTQAQRAQYIFSYIQRKRGTGGPSKLN